MRAAPARTLPPQLTSPLRSHPLEGAGIRRGRRGGQRAGSGGGPGAGAESSQLRGPRSRAGAGTDGLRRRRREDGRGVARRAGSWRRPVPGTRRGRGSCRVPHRLLAGRGRVRRGAGRGTGRGTQRREGAVRPPRVGRGLATQPRREGEGKVPQVHSPRSGTAPYTCPAPRRGSIPLIQGREGGGRSRPAANSSPARGARSRGPGCRRLPCPRPIVEGRQGPSGGQAL